MKVLVPLNNKDKIDDYILAGADEFYMGFCDNAWTDTFGKYCDINRMSGFGTYANKYCMEEVIKIIEEVKRKEKTIFITFNANVFGNEQISYIERHYFPKMREAGVDGIICSELALSERAINCGLNVVASTMMGIYNSDIVNFYKNVGIKRMIIPRDLTLDEISAIVKCDNQISFEAFFMRNGCVFSDCYCLGTHRLEGGGSTCGYLKKHSKTVKMLSDSFEEKNLYGFNDTLYNSFFHQDTCGMCALYRLMRIGVSSLKIVGRADLEDLICDDIALTKKNIAIARTCQTEQEYLERMIFPKHCEVKCQMGLNCYYPEVRFGDRK